YESNLENSFILNANLDALKKSASNVFQVQCTFIQEFNEGRFHKVYTLKMKDGKEYIEKLAISVYHNGRQKVSSDKIQYDAIKDDLVLKTEKELNIITKDLIITYKMDKTSKLDKTDALQKLKQVTRNNLLHELEADFKFYNYLIITY
ncbi:31319_t:CDS:2, partial [Gigaspora margarita]